MTKLTLKSTLPPDIQAKLDALVGTNTPAPAMQEKNQQSKPPPQGKQQTLLSKAATPTEAEKQKKPPAQMKKDWKGRLEKIKAVQAWLQETWPNTFNLKDPKPLKRHIEQDIHSHGDLPFSKLQLKRAIGAYTNRRAYHEAVLKADGRYDLQGNKVEEIKENEQAYSQQTLETEAQEFEKRKARQAARRTRKLSKKTGGKAVDKQPTVETSPHKD